MKQMIEKTDKLSDMENFEYHIPTRLIFGKGIVGRLPR